MDWNKFFKPDLSKISIVGILFLFSLFAYGSLIVDPAPSWAPLLFSIFYLPVVLMSFAGLDFNPWAPNLLFIFVIEIAYWYSLCSFIIWIYRKLKK